MSDVQRRTGIDALLDGRYREAAALLGAFIAEQPAHAEAHEHLGLAQWQLGDPAAVASLRRATELDPARGSAWSNLARVLVDAASRDAGALDEAVAAAARGVSLAPDLADAWANQGLAHKERGAPGDAAIAVEAYRSAVARDPTLSAAYGGLADLRGYTSTDEHVFAALIAHTDANVYDEVAWFARGHAFDHAGEPDLAWEAWTHANRVRSARVGPYDRAGHAVRTARLRAVPAPALAPPTAAEAGPLFVVGFPRSGTTVVEGLIARCDGVVSLGENPRLHALAAPWEAQATFPVVLPDRAWLTAAAASWRAETARAPASGRPVTKLPHDFEHLWLAARLFPDLRVVWVRRDRRDVALSCYAQPFATGHAYKHDVAVLFEAIDRSALLLDHARKTLGTRVFVVDYEALVASPATVTADLYAFLGLSATDGAAGTYQRSGDAHRRNGPLRGDSVGRWKAYARHLGLGAAPG